MVAFVTYYLVCHRHFFHLYVSEEKEVILVASERSWEPLVTLLTERKASKVHILDNSQSHSLKAESVSPSLRIHEYLQWCWQKWCHVRQNNLFVAMHMLRAHKSMLIGTSPSTLPLLGLWEQLEKRAIACTISSYPLALIVRLYELYGAQWDALSPPLLVIVDREGHTLLAFLLKGKLVAVRHYHLSSTQDTQAFLPKNIIMDTIKYVEKNLNVQGVTPLFFLEDTALESVFRELFPNSIFHGPPITQTALKPLTTHSTQRSPVMVNTSGPRFDTLVLLGKPPRLALMRLQGGVLQNSRFTGLTPYIKMLTFTTALTTLYAMYSAFHLMLVNQKLVQKLDHLNQQVQETKRDITKIPLSAPAIARIESVLAHSKQQNTQINTYLKLLERLLNNQHVMQSLSINGQKSRFSIAETDSTTLIDDLVELGKNTFSQFEVVTPKNAHSPLFVIETKSPFIYEKSSQ
jgi:hypothetical protein